MVCVCVCVFYAPQGLVEPKIMVHPETKSPLRGNETSLDTMASCGQRETRERERESVCMRERGEGERWGYFPLPKISLYNPSCLGRGSNGQHSSKSY